MATILSISSEVACGHVGNSAARFALQRLGHQVWALPTVILSNHPGHPHKAGFRTDPAQLSAMLAALSANGWLTRVDAVLTGYLPSVEHVDFAAAAITQIQARRPDAIVLVDPVLGDDPEGLYIDAAAAQAIRDRLLPLADVTTPNRFELHWLTGLPANDVMQAEQAAQRLGCALTIATSVPSGDPAELINLLIERGGGQGGTVRMVPVAREAAVPHGTGDLLAALFLGHRLHGAIASTAFAASVAGVRLAVAGSRGQPDLDLAGSQGGWSQAADLLAKGAVP